MFILTRFKDVVKISPKDFKGNFNEAIAKELNNKLSNKVFLNIGLCITLFDIEKIEESFIFPGDGSSHTKVVFRYVVFKPFKEEILIGKIRSCSEEGVVVSLGFFDDIIIPPSKLQSPSRYDSKDRVWIWEYDVGDGKTHPLYMDRDELVRFRVYESKFFETPLPKSTTSEGAQQPEEKISPFVLEGAVDEPGLGPLSWWLPSDEGSE
ncbi:DNA-directed RNA polymerase III subunit RPC8 [Cotesia glomerata]|uniref:DNA-directed RNA polymerase III subunit RPC8 n=1 Tax=Cotesia glomerata TaxID=32391 RepID=A0AAV7IES3_COTGL|nr:DNA-directed RNA polymerase III subunit RPC8 [Cotesia glomerata]KAH0550196.1 hypothetical protein KQX54_017998 [Cotesia glomerata]